MVRVADNPFCVWYDTGRMRTFKTEARAVAFAKSNGGRIGVWEDMAGWWIESERFALPGQTKEECSQADMWPIQAKPESAGVP